LNKSFSETKPIFLSSGSGLDFCIERSNGRGDEKMRCKGININLLALGNWELWPWLRSGVASKTTMQIWQPVLAGGIDDGVPQATMAAPINGGRTE
jgi:hypothetical protein